MDTEWHRRFCFFAVLLLVAGLVTGALIPVFENPRMGVAAHTTAVQSGTMLLAFAALWDKLRLTQRFSRITAAAILGSTYGLWLALLAAAALGTSARTPLAGRGFAGTPLQEQLVSTGLLSSSIAMLIATSIVLVGLRGRAPQH